MDDPPQLLVSQALTEYFFNLPRRPWEVGGWLLGYWTADRGTIIVTDGTPPAVRGSPFGVTISGRGHLRRFDEAWSSTGGQVTFIGDWHTHPGGPTTPSSTDRDAMQQLAEDGDYGTVEPLIAIASVPRLNRVQAVEVAFYLRRSDGQVVGLPAVLFDDLPGEAQGVPEWPWPRRRRARSSR